MPILTTKRLRRDVRYYDTVDIFPCKGMSGHFWLFREGQTIAIGGSPRPYANVPGTWMGPMPSNAVMVVTHVAAMVVRGSPEIARDFASASTIELCERSGAVVWSRHIDQVMRTSGDDDLERRLLRVERYFDWLLSSKTDAGEALLKLGARPLRDGSTGPGKLSRPYLVAPRCDLHIRFSFHDIAVLEPFSLRFEISGVYSQDS